MTMATLREYFGAIPGTTFPMEQELSLAPVIGEPASLVIARLYIDFSSYTRYISFFIKEGEYSPAVATYLSQNAALVIGQLAESLKITSGHPAVHNSTETTSDELPFSGRVYLFIDQLVPEAEKDQLRAAAANVNVALEIRDKEFSEFLSVTEKPLAFISHDSRDKPFVRTLAEKLSLMRCPVWYDEYSLKVGDSLRESIDKGLKETAKCIVVLSPDFINNPGWTKAEFNAAMNKHISSSGSVILPIWHNVTREEVEAYSSLIVDTIALKSDIEVDELARKLFAVISPSI
jgi:TIR domain